MDESGFIWLLIIGGFIIYRVIRSNQQNQAVKKAQQKIDNIGDLKTRVVEDEVEFEGRKLSVFKVEIKGFVAILGTTPPNQGIICTYIFDQTNGKKMYEESWPILASFDSWSEPGTSLFRTQNFEVNGLDNGYHFTDWATLFVIPKDVLNHPYKGKRTLGFITYVTDTLAKFKYGQLENRESIINVHQCQSTYNFDEIGYKESIENRPRIIELSIQLALKVASMDSNIDQDEINEVKNWIGIKVETDNFGNEEKILAEKSQFGKYLQDASSYAEKNSISQIEITKELNDKASKQQKYDALELMLDVMTSDSDASAEEMSIIDDVVKLLNLDPNTYKELRQSRLTKVENISTNQSADESIFGIDNSMSNEEICSKLADQYEEWSQRLALPDKATSKRAKEMCDKIIDLRKKYKCT